MSKPNEQGCYVAQTVSELARHGRSYVEAEIACCQDGLFRFGITIHTSYSGMASPIYAASVGHRSARLAEDAALLEALRFLKGGWTTDPLNVRRERSELKAQLEARLLQPSLF